MKPNEALRPWIPQQPPPTKPTRPWVHDLEPAPPVAEDLSARVAQAKTAAKVGRAAYEARPAPSKPVVDRENPSIVPKSVYGAVAARLDAAK